MAQETRLLLNPFSIDIDPMERLLLVNFENDPDTLYVGFEPQVFSDTVNGHGHIVIGWRQDGKVDVYHQPGVSVDPHKYDIAGKGLKNLVERSMDAACFEVSETGVQAYFEFLDIHNRKVIIRISERNKKRRKPFGLLAPMGDAAENPSAMPLVMLQDFYFVREKLTDFELSIDGKLHQPDKLPLPMDWSRMLFARYSTMPLIATFNPAADGPITFLNVHKKQESVSWNGHEIELMWPDNKPVIKRIIRHNDIFPVELRFKEFFPDIESMAENTSKKGAFEIEGHPSAGLISGHYVVEKNIDGVTITLIPSGGWKPRPEKLSLRLLYRFGKIFKTWPTTYEWTASITEIESGEYHIRSGWNRISTYKSR